MHATARKIQKTDRSSDPPPPKSGRLRHGIARARGNANQMPVSGQHKTIRAFLPTGKRRPGAWYQGPGQALHSPAAVCPQAWPRLRPQSGPKYQPQALISAQAGPAPAPVRRAEPRNKYSRRHEDTRTPPPPPRRTH